MARGYPVKEDTPKHYQAQLDLYGFLLKENGFKVEDYAYLLFYYPKEVLSTGEVIFDTKLVKMNAKPVNGRKTFQKAIKLIQGRKPKASEECEYCKWLGKMK